ncbi:MAG: GspH/FimT family pseudopilin [Fimbriimonas sp.]
MRPRLPSKSRGFTLIEMMVVVVVLSVVASMIVPNLVRAQEGQRKRDFEASVFRLASYARERAIQEHKTISLSMSSRSFVVNDETDREDDTELRSLEMPEGVDTGAFAAEGEDSTSSDWRLRFYADGTSDGGGVELNNDGRIRSLEVKPNGSMKLVEGSLEESGTEKWMAGEIEKRG